MRRTPRASRRSVLALVLSTLTVLLLPLTQAKDAPPRKIGPGPRQMSDEEKALGADPNIASSDAVILIEESELDEQDPLRRRSYHLRALILSSVGRDLANVEVQLYGRDAAFEQWWGFVLLPDGTIHDVPRAEVVEQRLLTRGETGRVRAFKALMPGVVPGAVLDYGYVVSRNDDFEPLRRINLEGSRPVRRFMYTWKPAGTPAACYMRRTEGLQVQARRERQHTFVIEAQDLPVFVEEPMAPPDDDIRAGFTCYYGSITPPGGEFWRDFAKFVDEQAIRFVKRSSFLKKASKDMNLPPEADITARLAMAYDWLGDRFQNVDLLTAEDVDETTGRAKESPSTATDAMSLGRAGGMQIDFLYMGLARSLGARAYLVLAPDATKGSWRRDLFSYYQFDDTLVALFPRPDSDEGMKLVDPGSGLAFGDVPWWVTGTKALMATPGEAREIAIPSPEWKKNVSETHAEIALGDDRGAVTGRWSFTGVGQVGVRERRDLIRISPQERVGRLKELCGESSDFVSSTAEAPSLLDLKTPFRLTCAGELVKSETVQEEGNRIATIEGPWLEEVPEFSASKRIHPIVFPFPRTDLATIEVAGPAGFMPSSTFDPIRIDHPLGNYLLIVTPTSAGYHVERSFSLKQQKLAPANYAGLRQFLLEVRRADRTPLVFKRTQAAS